MTKSTTAPNTTPNTNNTGDEMNNTQNTNRRSAFDNTTRSMADASFNMTDAADIGLKTLIAATCGVVLYKSFTDDK